MKKEQVGAFLTKLSADFEAEIGQIPTLKKKVREDLAAGFRDGARACLFRLQQAGEVEVEE